MKNFWSTFLACLLALVVANVVIGVFLVMVLAGIGTLFSETVPDVQQKTVLRLDFAEPISDDPSRNPLSEMGFNDLISMRVARNYALIDVLKAIETAATDDRISGIYLNVSPNMGMGMATLEEIRDALLQFKESGKFIVSYADYYTQGSYYMATAADKVYLNPQGNVTWLGLASGVVFYKGLLDKLGVQVEAIRHGSFKSAVEPFILDKMSPENRLQMDALLGSIWGHVVKRVSDARGIDSAQLQRYASDLALRSARNTVDLKMVDSLVYASDVERMLCEMTDRDEEPEFVSLGTYIDQPKTAVQKLSRNKIAVVYAEGQIVDGKSREGLIGGSSLAARLARVRTDDQVKAVVLRVNSPGGSALASEVIWHEVEQIRQLKPVIVSMGNMAASCGYYISCPADVILASPVTLTGSIGVFGLMLNGEKGLQDKLGITVDVAKTNPSADMDMAVFGAVGVRPMNQAERDFMQNSVEQVYSAFVGHVAEGRNMTAGQVDSVGGGRVWSGESALRIGLIDGFGGLRDAVALAADRAGVADDFRIVSPEESPDRLTQLLKLFSAETRAELFRGEMGEAYRDYETLRNMLYQNSIQALSPYRVAMP